MHRTVARSHLEKLAKAGLLVMGTRRNPGGGRPAKVYSPSNARLDIQLPPRRYETLSAMLVRLAAKLDGSSATLAEQVGYECGREAAADLSRGRASGGGPDLESVIAYLRDTGCSPRVGAGDDGTVVVEVEQLPVPRGRPRSPRAWSAA